jgi:hypothetical protein
VCPVSPFTTCRPPSSSMAVISSIRSETLADLPASLLLLSCVTCTAGAATVAACRTARCKHLRPATIAIAIAATLSHCLLWKLATLMCPGQCWVVLRMR